MIGILLLVPDMGTQYNKDRLVSAVMRYAALRTGRVN